MLISVSADVAMVLVSNTQPADIETNSGAGVMLPGVCQFIGSALFLQTKKRKKHRKPSTIKDKTFLWVGPFKCKKGGKLRKPSTEREKKSLIQNDAQIIKNKIF